MRKEITRKEKIKALLLTSLVLIGLGFIVAGIKYKPEFMQLLFGWICLLCIFILAGVGTYHIVLGKDLDDYN